MGADTEWETNGVGTEGREMVIRAVNSWGGNCGEGSGDFNLFVRHLMTWERGSFKLI